MSTPHLGQFLITFLVAASYLASLARVMVGGVAGRSKCAEWARGRQFGSSLASGNTSFCRCILSLAGLAPPRAILHPSLAGLVPSLPGCGFLEQQDNFPLNAPRHFIMSFSRQQQAKFSYINCTYYR
jgi:hypothetical protein